MKVPSLLFIDRVSYIESYCMASVNGEKANLSFIYLSLIQKAGIITGLSDLLTLAALLKQG